MTGCLVTLQVKVAILKYIESLARQMDPTDFVNSSETRLAVSRIITWTTEPKSSDVRKVNQLSVLNLIYCNSRTNISGQLHTLFGLVNVLALIVETSLPQTIFLLSSDLHNEGFSQCYTERGHKSTFLPPNLIN